MIKKMTKNLLSLIPLLAALTCPLFVVPAGAFSVDVKNLYYSDPSGPREINYDFSAGTVSGPNIPVNSIGLPSTNPPILQKNVADIAFMFGNIPVMGTTAVTLNTTSQICTIATTQGGAILSGASAAPPAPQPPAPATSWTYALALQNFSGVTDAAKEYKFEIGTGAPTNAGPQPKIRGMWSASGTLLLLEARIFDDADSGTTLWSGDVKDAFAGLTATAPTGTTLELKIINDAATVTFSYRLNSGDWTTLGTYTIGSGVIFNSLPARFPYFSLREATPESPFQVSSQHWNDAQGDVYKAWPRVYDPGQALYSGITLNSQYYLAETPLAYNSAAGYWALSGTLFSDDFNDNSVDTAKWATQGTSVTENEGIFKVAQAVANTGGTALSRAIIINPYAPITVQRKATVHYANNNFDGVFALHFGDTSNVASWNDSKISVVVSHANYNSTTGDTAPANGFYLGRYPARFPPSSAATTSAIWDTEFVEKIVYNPVSGLAELYINEVQKATINLGALPAGARYLKVYLDAWGLNTGHYNYSDDLTVSQPWTGGDVFLSISTSPPSPPASFPVFNFTATKKAGGTEAISKTITGYVTDFATNLAPSGNVTNATPTFSWTGISGATFYSVQVSDANYNRIWNKNNIPAGTTSAVYNDDSAGSPLVSGQTYNYEIVSSIVTGGVNNDSFAKGSFTYTGTLSVTNLLQNGSFSGNLNGWIVNPALQTGTPPWTPLLQDGSGVTLHPLTSDFNGMILYQNLNLTGVGGKTFNLSMKLTKVSALSGQTVAAYLTYVDGGILVRSKIPTSPVNDGISTATPVAGSFTVPGTATKLVKLEIVKEYYGEFHADDIVLWADGVTAGLPPTISSISAPSGTYSSSLTISGLNFGSAQGTVSIGGVPVNVAAWADTAITVTVASPARSGPIVVVAGGVESNIDKTFQVSSPYFTVDVVSADLKVIKGQTAEFLLKSAFYNGFTSSNGINLQLHEPGTIYLDGKATFTPVPIKGNGGVLLKIDTANLNAGNYTAHIQTNDGGTIAFAGTINLTVVTVSDIKFYEMTGELKTYVTSKAVAQQGQIQLYGVMSEVTVSDGTNSSIMTDVPLTYTGGGPKVSYYRNSYGSFDFYAEGENGTATVNAVAPDGFSKPFNFIINIPSTPRVLSIGLTSPVTNADERQITFSAEGTQAIGYGSSGFLSTKDSTIDWIDDANTIVGGTFKLDLTTPPDLGTYLYNAFTFDAGTSTTAQKVAPLIITNDPSYAMIKGGVRPLDPSIPFFALEHFTLAFYNAEGVKQFSRQYSSYTHSGEPNFELGAVTPGSYKILLIPQAQMLQPQWYPNATSLAGAATVPFNATGTVDNIYFFAQMQPIGATLTLTTTGRAFNTTAATTGSVTFTTSDPGFVWSAASDLSWITITSGVSGAGNGQVNYAMAANTAADLRTGAITIGGQIFTVTQPGSSTVLKGDIDGINGVNLADAILALKIVTGMNQAGIRANYPVSGADVNGDGKVGLQEIGFILQTVAGLRQ